MSVQTFINWCNSFPVGIAIRKSQWLFPIIETVHLLALTILLGTLIIVSLRVFGVVMRQRTVADVTRELAPWTITALATMILSGALLFLSEATKCYESPPFRIKMVCLLLAIVYHFAVYRRIMNSQSSPMLWSRLGAVMSLLTWFSVGLAGRAIGFY